MARRRSWQAKEPRKTKEDIRQEMLQELNTTVDRMMDHTRWKQHKFNTDKFLRLFWGDREIDAIQTVCGIVQPNQIRGSRPQLPAVVTLTHPAYPKTITQGLFFRLDQPSGGITMWPRDLSEGAMRPDHDPAVKAAFHEVIHDVAMEALDRATILEVCHVIINSCTHEQARYIFPPYLSILRRAGMDDIANSVEHIKRPPPPVLLAPMMRQKIRWAIQWFAMQELLGTWERQLDYSDQPETEFMVTLDGNQRFPIHGVEGTYWLEFEP